MAPGIHVGVAEQAGFDGVGFTVPGGFVVARAVGFVVGFVVGLCVGGGEVLVDTPSARLTSMSP